jgi:DNA-binding PadR family transcriptional regulator
MSETTLTTLEVLLLALVDQGWKTPYRLKEAAGISVGAALPALNRLQSQGLLKRAEVAARKKQEFDVTSAGKKAVSNEMKRLLKDCRETPPNDAESALRLAALAFFSKRRGIAVSLLKSTGEVRRRQARLRSEQATNVVATDLATLYRRMGEACEAARSEAEAEAMITLAGQLKRIKSS